MDKFQTKVDDVTNIVKENLRLLEKRQVTCEDLVASSENLSDLSKQFSRVSKENKWRIWWKNNLRKIQLISLFLGIIIILIILLIVLMTIIYRHQ